MLIKLLSFPGTVEGAGGFQGEQNSVGWVRASIPVLETHIILLSTSLVGGPGGSDIRAGI